MLNYFIKNIEKVSQNQLDKIFQGLISLYEKYDGVKINIIRNTNEFDPNHPENNWIVCYKRDRIYPEEFSCLDSATIKENNAIGFSQFKFVWDWLRENHVLLENIPIKTEMFFEFIMNKPTITRDYEKLYEMIFLGAQMVDYQLVDYNKIETKRLLGLSETEIKHITRIRGPRLIGTFDSAFFSINGMKQILESSPSEFGGYMEGLIIKSDAGTFKILQPDQHSEETRNAKKNRYRMSKELEQKYKDEVKQLAQYIIGDIFPGDLWEKSIRRSLSQHIYIFLEEFPQHSKKNEFQVKDDIYETLRKLIHGENNGINTY